MERLKYSQKNWNHSQINATCSNWRQFIVPQQRFSISQRTQPIHHVPRTLAGGVNPRIWDSKESQDTLVSSRAGQTPIEGEKESQGVHLLETRSSSL